MHRRDKIYKETLKPYKFYLSFENTKCQEYITEKFFTAVGTEEVIPIALGGTSIEDYNNVAPPHSFIHLDDFDTIEDLSNHLTVYSSITETRVTYTYPTRSNTKVKKIY